MEESSMAPASTGLAGTGPTVHILYSRRGPFGTARASPFSPGRHDRAGRTAPPIRIQPRR
jgi:hypothetical protein